MTQVRKRTVAQAAQFLGRMVRAGGALAVLALAGCAAGPPGANNPEIHPGAALVPGGGAPGLNGPFHMQSEYKS